MPPESRPVLPANRESDAALRIAKKGRVQDKSFEAQILNP
jgi:hypothetical protein